MHDTSAERIPLVDLATQSQQIKAEVLESMSAVIDSARYILGQEVQEFETDFAKYCQADHCVAVANGTEALHLSLRALGIGEGDEVITAGNSFAATPFAIAHAGATPIFVDVDPSDFNLDCRLVEQAITDRTKAILPVHLYGQPARMDQLSRIADKHNLLIIEDSAQAHGAELNGQRCGSLGDIGCFSFYPGKNLGAFGDAGAIVTNSAELADELRLMRNYGQKVKNRHDLMGYNSRLDTLQACVLLTKMKHIEDWTEKRRLVAQWYREELAETDLLLPTEHDDVRHVYHLFVVRHPHRDQLVNFLADRGISCGIHYPNPLFRADPFRYCVTVPDQLPTCSRLAKEILSLPMYPELTRDMVSRIAQAIREFLTKQVIRES